MVDVVFYAEGKFPGICGKHASLGSLFPYAMLRKLKKKRNLKASKLHIVLILVLGGQSAKVMSEVLRGELAGFTE